MCEHLLPIEQLAIDAGIRETFRGQPWTDNCREWVYYDCFFNIERLREKLSLPDFVEHHHNDDPRSGVEEGFCCSRCNDAVIGHHRIFEQDKEYPVVG